MGLRAQKSQATKKKLLDAVEAILSEDGFTGLKVEAVSAKSGVDKKLIYFHFGDFKGLLDAFLKSNDFWFSQVYPDIENMPLNIDSLKGILTHQFESMFSNKLLQQLIVWELAENNEVLVNLSNERDQVSDQLIDKLIENEGITIDLRPKLAIIIAGIYYLSIHTKTNGSKFCGLDLNDDLHKDRLKKAMLRLVDKIS